MIMYERKYSRAERIYNGYHILNPELFPHNNYSSNKPIQQMVNLTTAAQHRLQVHTLKLKENKHMDLKTRFLKLP